MARDNSIAVSDEEMQKIKDARLKLFSTNEVPYGAVIEYLAEMVLEDE
jgi:hypothetical protein